MTRTVDLALPYKRAAMLDAHRMMLKMSDLDAAPNEYRTITASKITQNLQKKRYILSSLIAI